jgi:hypothetical protein
MWLLFSLDTRIAFGQRRNVTPNQTFYGNHRNVKVEIKKLGSRLVQAKMDWHDLSKELPANWERIPQVAQKTFQTCGKLIAAKLKLAALDG